MPLVRPFVLAAFSILAVAGCADEATSASDDSSSSPNVSIETDTVEERVEIDFKCPQANVARFRQRSAHAVLNFALGSDTATIFGNPRPTNQACSDALANIVALRGNIVGGKCTVETPNHTSTVCGLKALRYKVTCAGLAPSSFQALKSVADNLDGCFGAGTGAFFLPAQDTSQTIEIDPEPALLKQVLSGSTGATAAAVYVNEGGASTNAVKWPGTYYANPNLLPGTPCSTVDLAKDSIVTKVIQAQLNSSGAMTNQRRCL